MYLLEKWLHVFAREDILNVNPLIHSLAHDVSERDKSEDKRVKNVRNVKHDYKLFGVLA